MLCDEELNYCELNKDTCQNGGKCQSMLEEDGSFKCECPSGYKGENCEIAPAVLITTTTIKPGFNETIVVDDGKEDNDKVDDVKETEDKPESDELDNEA